MSSLSSCSLDQIIFPDKQEILLNRDIYDDDFKQLLFQIN